MLSLLLAPALALATPGLGGLCGPVSSGAPEAHLTARTEVGLKNLPNTTTATIADPSIAVIGGDILTFWSQQIAAVATTIERARWL